MKQTAVEWLLNEFQEVHKDYGGLDTNWLKRFDKAKEMEKEQIIEAHYAEEQDGEQYYNETFKSE